MDESEMQDKMHNDANDNESNHQVFPLLINAGWYVSG